MDYSPTLHISLSGFQIILELEKQRVEVLCNILTRYNLQMSSFGQTLNHVRHREARPHHRDSLWTH